MPTSVVSAAVLVLGSAGQLAGAPHHAPAGAGYGDLAPKKRAIPYAALLPFKVALPAAQGWFVGAKQRLCFGSVVTAC